MASDPPPTQASEVSRHQVDSGSVSAPIENEGAAPEPNLNSSWTPEEEDTAVVEDDGYNPMTLDVDSNDSDSALGESILSSTVSMQSSMYESVVENGRTYHKYKEGNLQHHLFLLTLDGKLHLAPVHNPQLVLDFGTGTGIWAIDYATQNPSSTVLGTDLSPIQPDFVPPNCRFEVDDASDEWSFSQKFDFIHARAMFSCFGDPAAVFKQAYNALTPGSYFEIQDVYFKPHSDDGTVNGTVLERWNEMLIEAAKSIGRDWHMTPKYAGWFKEVGFENVVERVYAWPGNTWPKGKKQKTMGLWQLANGLEGLEAVTMAMMTRSLGMSAEEVQLLLVDVRRDAKDKSIHAYYPIYVVYGRKPS